MDPMQQLRIECLNQAIRTAEIYPEMVVGQAGAYEAYITGKESSVAKKAKKAKKVVKKAKKTKK